MRKHLVVLREPVRVELLDAESDATMQLPWPLGEQRVVHHVLRHGVSEHVGQLGEQALFVDQLEGFERLQELLGSPGMFPQSVDQPMRELPADDRGELQRALRTVLQPNHLHGGGREGPAWDQAPSRSRTACAASRPVAAAASISANCR
jgi:hypothetical protein